MPITRGQIATPVVSGSGTSITLTWATNPTPGSKVLVFLQTYGTITSATDNGTSPRTLTQDLQSNINSRVWIYRADDITLPASGQYAVTVTVDAATTLQGIGAEYLGAAPGGPVDWHTAAGSGSDINSGNASGPAGSLYFGGFGDRSGQNPESVIFNGSAPFAQQWVDTNGSSYWVAAMADGIVPAGGIQSLDWTVGDAPTWDAIVAVYAPETSPSSFTPAVQGGTFS